MNLLLDTHTALWWWTDPARLGTQARAAIAARANPCFFSAASGYELAQKQRWHPRFLPAAFLDTLPKLIVSEDWQPLPLNLSHTLQAGRFDSLHRDPFDRLLAAQAMIDDLTLITIDDHFSGFGVKRLW